MTDKDRAFVEGLSSHTNEHNDYVLKPYEFEKLISIVRGLDAYASVLERKWVAESKRELDTRVNSAT
jgi:hypothetical protein